jgi:hypothetical protein
VRPENLATSLECLRAVEDLELAAELFSVLAEKFPASRTIGAMVAQIIDRYRLIGTNSPAWAVIEWEIGLKVWQCAFVGPADTSESEMYLHNS